MFIDYWALKELVNKKVICTFNGVYYSIINETDHNFRLQQIKAPYNKIGISFRDSKSIFLFKDIALINYHYDFYEHNYACIYILKF